MLVLGLVNKTKNFISKHRTALLVLVLIVLVVGLSSAYGNYRSNQRAAAFEAQQKTNRANIAKTLYQARAKENKQKEIEDSKKKELLETLNLTQKSDLPSCDRLKNRTAVIITSSRCDYRLIARGSVDMAVVFLSDNVGGYVGGQIGQLRSGPSSEASLDYINTYLKSQQAQYVNPPDFKINLSYYGPFATNQPLPGTNDDLNDAQPIAELLGGASKNNAVPEDKYDVVHYVYVSPSGFRSFALPSSHRAYTSLRWGIDVPVFAHETLHLFGATDKYNNNDCNSRGKGDPFSPAYVGKLDIMCWSYGSFANININVITAREIGWKN